ncbi:MAG: hypothetical protein KUG72_13230 [Pseudomonadales bacterium]|nr:hypothetical protein [Pseudomonadales bacterium]
MSAVLASNDTGGQLKCLWQHPYYDRRKSMGVFNLRHLGVGGRRTSKNTETAISNTYVDIYDRSLAIDVFILMFMSALGVVLAQVLQITDAHQLSSVVNYVSRSAGDALIPLVMGVTGLVAVFLVIYHNFVIFQVLRVRTMLRALTVLYSAAVLCEIYLLVN